MYFNIEIKWISFDYLCSYLYDRYQHCVYNIFLYDRLLVKVGKTLLSLVLLYPLFILMT